MKQVSSNDLPAGLRSELDALLAAMRKKYGEAAVSVGVHIENMANLVGLLGKETPLTEEERAAAHGYAKTVTLQAIQDLGTAMNVDPKHAFAVAQALQDYGRRAEAELCGETIPAPVADAALAAIRKAQAA